MLTSRCLRSAAAAARSCTRASSTDEGVFAPFEEPHIPEEDQPRTHEKLGSCETWVYGIKGDRKDILSLSPGIFGLPPQIKLLGPVLRRQLKYKIQDEPYGSEDNNFVQFGRFADPLYTERPELKPWIKQGIAWKVHECTRETEIVEDMATEHMPIPHYTGDVPLRLREVGLKVLLSLKYRYNRLKIVDDLSTPDRYLEPAEFQDVLRKQLGVSGSCLMITGNHITPHFDHPSWTRREPFPAISPGTQRLWQSARLTTGCELREVGGLDVWSGLLYDTLILDKSAVTQLEDTLCSVPFSTPNISLRGALEGCDTSGALGPAKPRHKVVRVVNLDNL